MQQDLVKQLLYKKAPVRIVMQNDDPWFVAKDVCDALEIKDHNQSVRCLDNDEKGLYAVQTLGGPQETSIVSEPGLYKLIGKSRKPEAKLFWRWVTHDVLPTIRKHGMYMTPQVAQQAKENPVEFFARAVLAAHEIIVDQKKQLEAAAPAIALFENLTEKADHWFSVKDAANMLACKDMGRNNLFRYMQSKGWIKSAYFVYQQYIEAGYFKLESYTLRLHDKDEAKVRIKVSYLGLSMIARHLRSDGYKTSYGQKVEIKQAGRSRKKASA